MNQPVSGFMSSYNNTPNYGNQQGFNFTPNSNYLPTPQFGNSAVMADAAKISADAGKAGGMTFGQGLQMGTQAIGAVSDLYNMWQARQNYKLSKESFKFNKQLSTVNTNNQANLTNERLATRQAVRVNNDPNAVPVAQFMQSYGVKGIGG